MTIREALASGESALKKTSDAPRLDAERLLLAALEQKENSYLYAHAEDSLSATQAQCFKKDIARRVTGEPLAYILGYQEFFGRNIFCEQACPDSPTKHGGAY